MAPAEDVIEMGHGTHPPIPDTVATAFGSGPWQVHH